MNQTVLAARRWSLLFEESWHPIETWRLRTVANWNDLPDAGFDAAHARWASYVRRRVPVEIWPMCLDPENRRLVRHAYADIVTD